MFVVMGIFFIFYGILFFLFEIDQAFIVVILIVIGYFINDIVVVFDCIWEFLNNYMKSFKEEVINSVVNSMVSCMIIILLMILFVVVILFFFGGVSICGFVFVLFVGIFVGIYFLIFVAMLIMLDLIGEFWVKDIKFDKKGFFKVVEMACQNFVIIVI